MHSATVFFALAAIACVSAGGHGGHGHGHGHGVVGVVPAVGVVHDVYSRPAYTYNYAVSDKFTGDQKSASETRDGDVTKGSYSLVQPDGILRTVNYISTPLGGFQAHVINSGWGAAHPARLVAAAPVAVAPVAVAAAAPVAGGWGWGRGRH